MSSPNIACKTGRWPHLLPLFDTSTSATYDSLSACLEAGLSKRLKTRCIVSVLGFTLDSSYVRNCNY